MPVIRLENINAFGVYTLVLKMGKNSANHNRVIKYYVEQCKKLKPGFDCYFGTTNIIECVALSIVA